MFTALARKKENPEIELTADYIAEIVKLYDDSALLDSQHFLEANIIKENIYPGILIGKERKEGEFTLKIGTLILQSENLPSNFLAEHTAASSFFTVPENSLISIEGAGVKLEIFVRECTEIPDVKKYEKIINAFSKPEGKSELRPFDYYIYLNPDKIAKLKEKISTPEALERIKALKEKTSNPPPMAHHYSECGHDSCTLWKVMNTTSAVASNDYNHNHNHEHEHQKPSVSC